MGDSRQLPCQNSSYSELLKLTVGLHLIFNNPPMPCFQPIISETNAFLKSYPHKSLQMLFNRTIIVPNEPHNSPGHGQIENELA